jgi:hypothetical protein
MEVQQCDIALGPIQIRKRLDGVNAGKQLERLE